MIQVTLTQALLIYSLVLVCAFIVIWAISEIGARRFHRILGKQDLWRCVFCSYSYLDDSGSPITECPRCHSLNSVEDPTARPATYTATDYPQQDDKESDVDRGRRNPSNRKRPHQRRRGPRRR